ncbi:MAG: DUF2298 domain-containing protein [Deltaproteobacteria bacterium]|nr:DUF2298 domain-containing protein [Deltaproteobacteria bacterium]
MILACLFICAFFLKKFVIEFVFVGIAFLTLGSFAFRSENFSLPLLIIYSMLTWKSLRKNSFDFEGLIVFMTTLLVFLIISLNYLAVYVPLGERPRDFALLHEGYHNIASYSEPWFSNTKISYYIFWYLFYGYLGNQLNLSPPILYPTSLAITMALSCVFAYRLLLGESNKKLSAFTCSFVAVCLPNIKTIYSCLFQSCSSVELWWQASRTISHGITEYPLWSFYLGDLHPHFMSTPAILFLLSLFINGLKQNTGVDSIFLCILCVTYSLASNAWEIFYWCAVATCFFFCKAKRKIDFEARNFNLSFKHVLFITVGVGFATLAFSTLPNSTDKIKLINPLIESLSLKGMISHIGLQILLCLLCAFKIRGLKRSDLLIHLSGFSISLYFNNSFLLLIYFFFVVSCLKDSSEKFLILSSLSTLLIPEFLYVDDPYGGHYERMNTIFKTYYPVWIPLNLGVIILTTKTFGDSLFLSIILAVLTATGFAFNINSRPFQGTDFYQEIEKKFPGSKLCLVRVSQEPRNVLVESEKEPYSWDSFFCTVTQKVCYLGWSNHIGLLYRNYDEIVRRKRVIDQIYSGDISCKDLKKILETEKIFYVLVGPLEQERYFPNLDRFYNCLKLACESQRILVFKNESN